MWDISGWKRLTVHDDPPLVAVREEFLAWLAEVPEPHRVDLDARLRSASDHAHLLARLELFIHHYFRLNGWGVLIHPQVACISNRPDFLAEQGEFKLLVECRTFALSHSRVRCAVRMASIARSVSKGGDHGLGLSVRGAGHE